ncbi:hypothetical protein RvY_00671 [Ramazzottius varieornatus]|uniref:DnaJ homolog subfamily B member 9 n=1 Tax=Ramazzottius varieornatus TaxID=947166 RepID=A0A1D1UNE3_RAMVA|nr:hypothetical protein RvY_00671 [Ramazzottius varieornatus]
MDPSFLNLLVVILLQIIAASGQTYYEILGVQPNASPSEIKRAFHVLAKKYHPDKNEDGKQQFIRVRQAYEILADVNQRQRYDSKLKFESLFKSDQANRRTTQKPIRKSPSSPRSPARNMEASDLMATVLEMFTQSLAPPARSGRNPRTARTVPADKKEISLIFSMLNYGWKYFTELSNPEKPDERKHQQSPASGDGQERPTMMSKLINLFHSCNYASPSFSVLRCCQSLLYLFL